MFMEIRLGDDCAEGEVSMLLCDSCLHIISTCQHYQCISQSSLSQPILIASLYGFSP